MSEPRADVPAPLTRRLGRFWTLANALSLARLVLIVPVSYLIVTDGSIIWLYSLILLAVATDWFDGRVARWSKTVSGWGKVLDPLADKLAAAMVVLALVVSDVYHLPLWFLLLVILRDALIVLGGVVIARRTGYVLMSLWMGKVAVTALSVTVVAALLKADPEVMRFCLWTTTALYALSFLQYAVRFTRLYLAGNDPDAVPENARPLAPQQQEAGSIS